ncbi:uncharacterized protein TRIVIDRAFT_228495 [Trichoderma virens Gv29-8]|uniref:Uncharacterized protein n=1 Tax=Hypocrea virens (strain Gv29-8 / FGSC 10586) TaxID=413071 RepID=G9NCN9_HYPVG|nr:uncharacterized protein TRIVIDRAFT_228495 [Trichoderma virens Gv29-8]EHK15461.1 hypothetical protein TRIVIDRAFT_228495 [Trichoderma virens Gv29-8]UKZ51406.1 hypothetical protein TrVGV298_005165 [Trichoderma virens]
MPKPKPNTTDARSLVSRAAAECGDPYSSIRGNNACSGHIVSENWSNRMAADQAIPTGLLVREPRSSDK